VAVVEPVAVAGSGVNDAAAAVLDEALDDGGGVFGDRCGDGVEDVDSVAGVDGAVGADEVEDGDEGGGGAVAEFTCRASDFVAGRLSQS